MGVFRQFPYSNFHEMNMDEIIKIVKNMLEEWAQYYAEWDAWMAKINADWSNYQTVMNEAWQNLQDFINNYFDNLDVQNEINNKIASMVDTGEFVSIVSPFIPARVSEWLTAHITEPTGVVIDKSLSITGACADAKATGDAINKNKTDIRYISGLVETPHEIENAIHETGRTFRTSGSIAASDINSIVYFPCAVGQNYEIKCSNTVNLGLAFGMSYNYDTPLINMQLATTNYLTGVCPESAEGGFVIATYPTDKLSNIQFLAYNSNIEEINTEIDAINDEITDLHDSDANILDTISKIVRQERNLLEDVEMYEGFLYPHYSPNKSANSACNCFAPIPVYANTTYYFKNIWGNFSCILLADGNYVSFDQSIDIISGSYTPQQNGTAYITIESSHSSASALLTTNKAMYDNNLFDTRYIPNKLEVPKSYYVKKDGTGDFTKLTNAIATATKYMDSTVYVGPGTWDIIDELGSAYIESVGVNNRGLYLKNRVHLIFSSDSKVTCNYTGSTASVRKWLSAFNAGMYGFTLENCRIEASNCRYAVHDERDTDADQYTNVYKNCSMYMNNSTNTETTAHQCIGGGLGINGHIVIEDCDFESVNTRALPTSGYTPVSYHNSAGSGESRIDINGVYMVSGTVRLNSYGPSTTNTECYIHGCSFTRSIINEREPGGTTDNVNVTEWNNEIRS